MKHWTDIIVEGLGPDYKAPITVGARENEILSWFHSGMSDPLYALVSRTVRGGSTKASEYELDAAMEAIRDALKARGDDKLDRDDMQALQKLGRKIRALGQRHYGW